MSVISVKGIKKIYKEGSPIQVNALNGVDLEIEQGEFTAIVGPSGSGKTGILIQPYPGHVHYTIINIQKTAITGMKENKRINFRLNNIGFVFQAYNLIPVLTAKENTGFIMLLQNKSQAERNERVEELLTEVGLKDMMHKRPNELSGGQQQRVAVARALASKPKFVLADEPTANLDSVSTADLLDIMHRLNREEGMTFIFSTHDQRVIDRAERVITLEDGKIVSDIRTNA